MNTNVYENTDSETITPLNKRRILPVFLLVGLYAASTAAVMSVLPFYIREMGGSPLIIGIIIATEAFSQFCAAPLIGHLSDRVGRKRILIVTLAIAAISLLLLANAQCILFILLARTLFGISAGNLSAAAAYIADCTHVRNRRQAIGILTGCIGLGGIVGAGVSGWLSRISLSAPIYAAFILVLGSALVAIWGLKDPSTTSRTTDKIAAFSARAILKMPVLRVLIIVMLCHFFAYGMYSSQLPVFLSDTFIWNGLPFGPKALSYLLMADGVINIFVQLFLLGWVSQYFSERKLIILIFALLCTGFLTAGIATTIPVLVFAIVCISIADALAKPTYLAALSVHVSPARQGIVIGTAQALIAIADFISPVLGGFVLGYALYGVWIGTAPLAQVVVRHYELLSQHWSPDDMVTPAQWRHNVDIYIPETAKEHHALVVVNNGINYDKGVQITGKPGDFPQETLASISRDTNTIVISVSDIPNQYLTFQDDKKPLKEDESVSRSWALFMEAPEQRKLMPLNIPMVTALSQAMRLAKKELTQWNINSFIITGISKRGWTTWLSAIADPDVEAIVPFAIDLLDIDASLEHIYQSYGGNWPITFYPYYQQGIDEKIKSPTFTQLRQIIDPLRYLNTIYQPRLAIPKYIINASGDDFFVPDNTRFYYSKLPGVKSLRIVPNMNHYSINQFAEESLVPFINRFQSKKTLPQLIGLIHHHLLTVYFSEAPVKVVRWTANNPNARDFRYACGIRYQPLTIDIPANNKISITLNEPKTGWEATYIEATFNDGYVATSQVYITPDEKYPQTAPPSVNAACQTLPGRGLGENDSLD